ncbi:MAG: hypothetical protein Q9170_004727 [Blastenia crenularia]
MKSLILSAIVGTAALSLGVASSALPINAIKRYAQAGPCPRIRGEPHCLVVKRDGGPCWETPDGQIRCPLKERGTCWEDPNGQVHCDRKDKRGDCWEAPDGQVLCSEDNPAAATDSVTATDSATATHSATATDPAMTSATTIESTSTSTADSATMTVVDPSMTSSADSSSSGSTMDSSQDPSPPDPSIDDNSGSTDGSMTATTCVHTADGYLECGNVAVKRHDSGLKKRYGRPGYPSPCYQTLAGGIDCQAASLTTPGYGPRDLDERGIFAAPVTGLELPNIEKRIDLKSSSAWKASPKADPCHYETTPYYSTHLAECLRYGWVPKCLVKICSPRKKRDLLPRQSLTAREVDMAISKTPVALAQRATSAPNCYVHHWSYYFDNAEACDVNFRLSGSRKYDEALFQKCMEARCLPPAGTACDGWLCWDKDPRLALLAREIERRKETPPINDIKTPYGEQHLYVCNKNYKLPRSRWSLGLLHVCFTWNDDDYDNPPNRKARSIDTSTGMDVATKYQPCGKPLCSETTETMPGTSTKMNDLTGNPDASPKLEARKCHTVPEIGGFCQWPGKDNKCWSSPECANKHHGRDVASVQMADFDTFGAEGTVDNTDSTDDTFGDDESDDSNDGSEDDDDWSSGEDSSDDDSSSGPYITMIPKHDSRSIPASNLLPLLPRPLLHDLLTATAAQQNGAPAPPVTSSYNPKHHHHHHHGPSKRLMTMLRSIPAG